MANHIQSFSKPTIQKFRLPSELRYEYEYQKRIDAMTPAERVAISAAMFQWTREQLARLIVAEHGPMDEQVLKWHVALRLYGDEPIVREMIERELARISDTEAK